MLKKQEVESARLADFEFRLRARTMKLLAAPLDIEPAILIALVARHGDDVLLDHVAPLRPDIDIPALQAMFDACRAEARVQLIGELGDPSPHRLA
ncbi:hypothetical protein [Sphingomonas colocasiae]|uniref:hypothetical protein n=1 Tax=Sphingomonas colocasiae TaxID=1848973 RepID=UPI001FE29BFF|nr:hypothetical protein [Sphingomonas colocasiae]